MGAAAMAADQKRGLGRGLGSIFGSGSPTIQAGITQGAAEGDIQTTGHLPPRRLPLGQIHPNPHQPRRLFEPTALDELAQSIKSKGLLEPILVRPRAAGGYEILAGERRWRAAQMAQLHDVPVMVRECDDREALEIALIENIQREELNALEEAAAYRTLIDDYSFTQEKIAQTVGKSRPHVANALRLLGLPDKVKNLVNLGQLSAGHARAVLASHQPEKLADEIIAKGLTVRQAERRAQEKTIAPPATNSAKVINLASAKPVVGGEKDADTRALEDSLIYALGLKVDLRHRPDGSGELTISYKNLDQLDDLCRKLQN